MTTLPGHEELLAMVAGHRESWRAGRKPTPESVEPGEESVWDFPRPPRVEPVPQRIRVSFAGRDVADTTGAIRMVETAGAPVYYLPPADVEMSMLRETGAVSICEWKGAAIYYDLHVGDAVASDAAFSYPDPLDDLGRGYSQVAGFIGFYAGRVDACFIGDEKVTPQPGGVYAGWVTKNLRGPIKGGPGTGHW